MGLLIVAINNDNMNREDIDKDGNDHNRHHGKHGHDAFMVRIIQQNHQIAKRYGGNLPCAFCDHDPNDANKTFDSNKKSKKKKHKNIKVEIDMNENNNNNDNARLC